MTSALVVNRAAIASACSKRGVRRLRLFGSATDGQFDAAVSDVDVLVEFAPGIEDAFDAYFGLKEDLEIAFGRDVDLVMTDAVQNPHFAASALANAEELYAA